MPLYHVNAEWDEEAAVWVASSEDVPGLATGADTFEGLIEKLKVVIPDLLEANGLLAPGVDEVPFSINLSGRKVLGALRDGGELHAARESNPSTKRLQLCSPRQG